MVKFLSDILMLEQGLGDSLKGRKVEEEWWSRGVRGLGLVMKEGGWCGGYEDYEGMENWKGRREEWQPLRLWVWKEKHTRCSPKYALLSSIHVCIVSVFFNKKQYTKKEVW